MKKPYEYFNYLMCNRFITVGDDVHYAIEVDHDNKEITIYYQGSTTLENWKDDFTFWPAKAKPYKDMAEPWYAHKGIVGAWQNKVNGECARDVIMGELKKIHIINNITDYKIIVVGHSLGGGIAQLCAEDVCYNYGAKNVTVITFGSPKIFYGKKTKNHLEKLGLFEVSTCYSKSGDIVTTVPPFAFNLNLTKIGKARCLLYTILHEAEIHMGYGDTKLYE